MRASAYVDPQTEGLADQAKGATIRRCDCRPLAGTARTGIVADLGHHC